LIDNASAVPVAESVDLAWHPNGRHIAEPELGLTSARLRGIREAGGAVFVFVDDDNILRPDYLENAWKIGTDWPQLGVWGGSVIPRFEVPPPEWTRPHWSRLAVREVTRPLWSNVAYYGAMVCGAGMCLRAGLARQYAALVSADPMRRGLGRKGESLISCEDTDISMLAIDEGFGNGQFPSLALEHLIPARRATEEYLVKLTEEMQFSLKILKALRRQAVPRWSFPARMLHRFRSCRMARHDRVFWDAERRAQARFEKWLKANPAILAQTAPNSYFSP